MNTTWLPTTLDEVRRLGWDYIDIILFTGDAYVDHPSFGAAMIGRYLEKYGYRVAIVPQPNWQDDLRDFKKLGKPRLFFGVTAGNMDSMVNHYTAAKRLRSDDAYTAGDKAGFRPDYPTIVYTKALKQFFPDVPVVLGGIEASLRRVTHYDYWQDRLMPSFLMETGADLLVYGMGEKAVLEIARAFQSGKSVPEMQNIPQTAVFVENLPCETDLLMLPSWDECRKDKKSFARHFKLLETESNKVNPKTLIEACPDGFVKINPPFPLTTETEMDEYYALPFTRQPHPKYKKRGDVPAYTMIRNSVNIHRGCFGGCSFCTISAHQGKFVASRSEAGILQELEDMTQVPGFNGVITDLGGPSGNMYRMAGVDLTMCSRCSRPSCIFPAICKNLNTDHHPLISLYDKSLKVKNIKRVYIGSGVRYDLFTSRPPEETKKNAYNEYVEKLVSRHVSGRLKVAPEHTSDRVLKLMRKPSFTLFHEFRKLFLKYSEKHGLKQQIIPYFISSHPACEPEDMAELAADTRSLGFQLEQVQDLTPTPMTLSAAIYYTGIDPYTMKPVYTARSRQEKEDQKRFFFWYKPENGTWISQQLRKMNRPDLLHFFKAK